MHFNLNQGLPHRMQLVPFFLMFFHPCPSDSLSAPCFYCSELCLCAAGNTTQFHSCAQGHKIWHQEYKEANRYMLGSVFVITFIDLYL